MDFKVECDVAMRNGKTRRDLSFIKTMNVGDSFLTGLSEQAKANSFTTSVRYYSNSNGLGFKFSLGKTDKGFRIWRTA